ncbi:MAG: hypothetical protein HYZ44_16130 [Bacteroidetes bacterium]|nr:hypothetical protein [Bacteroidota bacterium]
MRKKFDVYRTKNLQEKIYVHTDRPTYLTGETVWFKIYLTDASLHKALDLSRVAYLEVINANDAAALQLKIEMKKGVGNGSFAIPIDWNTGNYTIRCYTNWMKNFDSDLFFEKNISIINPFKAPELDISANTIRAQFFPEGGNMVAGIKSKVAFQVVDEHGQGIDFLGCVLNERNDTIVKFAPLKFGMGHFTFAPSQAHQYRARIQTKAGNSMYANLPVPLSTGYSMHVVDSFDNKVVVQVRAALHTRSFHSGAYLFIHARNMISHVLYLPFTSGSCDFIIERNDLLEGISHLTLFDTDLQPQCERLIFNKPKKGLELSVVPSESNYTTRQAVSVELRGALKEEFISSNCSVSVFRIDSLPHSVENIKSYFWLTSELGEKIESPEYYFSADASAEAAADNLMLTHGWRRFKWREEVLDSTRKKAFLPERNAVILEFKILQGNQPISGIDAYLSMASGQNKLWVTKSNGDGIALFEIPTKQPDSKLFVQTHSSIDSALLVEMQSPYSKKSTKWPAAPLKLSSSFENQLTSRSVGMQVQNIYAEEQNDKSSEKLTENYFYGLADEVYQLDDYTRFPVMEEILREYVSGVFVRKRKDGFHFSVYDQKRKSVFEQPPMMLLDGMPIFDEDELMKLDPTQIKTLEVITRKWHLGEFQLHGIVSLKTYEGEGANLLANPRLLQLDYVGLNAEKEFYSPSYQSTTTSRVPDYRHLLYWNPSMQPKDVIEKLSFFTSDITGKYKIVVEGISENGMIGYTEASFSVDKK